MTTAPAHPSLPQNDTSTQQAARAAQIAASRTVYTWSDTVATLPGVPVAATVPFADEPTLEWGLILVGILLGVARNQLAVKLTSVDKGELSVTTTAEVAQQQARLDVIHTTALSIAAKHAPTLAPGSNIVERGLVDLEIAASTAEAAVHLATLRGHAEELRDIIAMTDAERSAIGASANDGATLDQYRALFDTLPMPSIGWTFVEDDVFARLRVAGPNAVLIERVTALPANFPLSADAYAAVVNGDTLTAALADGRLYLADYAALSILIDGEWDGLPKYVWQPMALFAVPSGGDALVPVAIQCGQDASKHPIFTPSPKAAHRWGWEIAKFIVQVADGNFHELFVHLARTHLVIEAIAVATRRNLANIHPIWALLVPHFEGSLFINNEAAGSLIKAGGPIDHIFAGTIASSQLCAATARLEFDFNAHKLPANLAARGVDDVSKFADYPYRDDALLVWSAIHDWAQEYVRIYYADDGAVTADTELADWTASIEGEGKVKNFGPIATRDELAEALTMILFTASAQHAAVNFPQKDVMSFAPAITGAAWADAPAHQSGHSKADWLATMPPLSLALEQLNVLTLLGSLHYRPLGDYRSNDFPYAPWFQDPQITGPGAALARFRSALAEVETTIAARNAERMWPYPYLAPSLIPTSINI